MLVIRHSCERRGEARANNNIILFQPLFDLLAQHDQWHAAIFKDAVVKFLDVEFVTQLALREFPKSAYLHVPQHVRGRLSGDGEEAIDFRRG